MGDRDVDTIPLIEGLNELELIGVGGSSRVYAAREKAFGRAVAVKVLVDVTDNAGRRRFEQERQLMGSMGTHPNVVTPHSFGYTPAGEPYLVMEHLPGGSLADRLIDEGPMPWADAVDVLLPIVDALGTAHAAGIVHRDVKPGNILLTATGQPKLTDFGIASVQDLAAGRLAVSVAHCPPEAFGAGRDATDARSDLYSLASTLYTLVTGAPPFARAEPDSAAAYLRRIESEPVPGVGSAAYDQFFASALAKDPDDRPRDAAELREWLLRTRTVDDRITAATLGAAAGGPSPAMTAALAGMLPTMQRGGDDDVVEHAEAPPFAAAPTGDPGGPGDGGRRRRLPVVAGVAALVVIGAAAFAFGTGLFEGGTDDPDLDSDEASPVVAIVEDEADTTGGSADDDADPAEAAAGTGDEETDDPATADQADGGRESAGSAPSDGDGATTTPSSVAPGSTAPSADVVAAEAAYERGVTAYQSDDLDAALGHFDDAVALDPAHPAAYIFSSLIHRVRGDVDQAIADGDRAVANGPDNGDAWLNRGIALWTAGRTAEALPDLDEAIRLKPDSDTAYQNRGRVNEDLGNYADAVADYTKVLSLNPDQVGSYWLRGRTHARAGDVESALADVEAFLALASDSDGRISAAEDLAAELRIGNNPFADG